MHVFAQANLFAICNLRNNKGMEENWLPHVKEEFIPDPSLEIGESTSVSTPGSTKTFENESEADFLGSCGACGTY